MNAILMLFLNPIAERFLQVRNPRSLWIVLSMIYSLLMRLPKILVLALTLLILKCVHASTIIRWIFWSLYIMLTMRLRLLSLVCFLSPNQLQLPNLFQLQLPNQ